MGRKWEKFLSRHTDKKEILKEIIQDIQKNNLNNYSIIPLKGYTDIYRIRKGKVRIIFEKGKENKILAIDTRGHIYRGIK
ncbi:type II toxin-antitoxin system RelE/ParE family toxin [Candidatus Gracilibacteria bacterium]|nr:type II toxin-antitoxin system RelE/ParE family toxin [Candidatus Gracilibacteria bacterium]